MDTSPNTFVSSLKLDFDPFDVKASGKDFFPGGGRQDLLDELVSMLRSFGAMLAVTGELGVGKTTLAHALTQQLGKESVCVFIQATLFMSRTQFLEQLTDQLSLSFSADQQGETNATREAQEKAVLDAISEKANDLAHSGRKLVLIIDDAQELASDVHDSIAKLMKRNSGGGFCVVLLGEPQLESLLQRGLPTALSQQVQYREFPVFSREDSEDYVRHKLARAGFRKTLPLTGGELGRAHNSAAGHPGKLNSQIAMVLNAATKPAPAKQSAQESESLVQLGGAYWAAAGGLLLVLLLVVFWPAGDPASENAEVASRAGQSIPVAVNRATDREGEAETQAPAGSSPDQSATEDPAVAVSSNLQQAGIDVAAQPVQAESEREAGQQVQQQAQLQAEQAAQRELQREAQQRAAAEAVAQIPPAADSTLTAFERRLLAAEPGTYTVQLLGARSASSIQQFLEQHPELSQSGYFETRYQNQPWFVAVSGVYTQRSSAEAAIAAMPSPVRQLQPWVRSLADIQSTLRDRHNLP
jgi:septal ring-binding cell division protein DamX/type II secretory pathway predicted ATPase ExeA